MTETLKNNWIHRILHYLVSLCASISVLNYLPLRDICTAYLAYEREKCVLSLLIHV